MVGKKHQFKKYRVFAREVHVQEYTIRAKDEKDAIELVAKGNGDAVEDGMEYSHMCEPEGCKACGIGKWTVEEAL